MHADSEGTGESGIGRYCLNNGRSARRFDRCFYLDAWILGLLRGERRVNPDRIRRPCFNMPMA